MLDFLDELRIECLNKRAPAEAQAIVKDCYRNHLGIRDVRTLVILDDRNPRTSSLFSNLAFFVPFEKGNAALPDYIRSYEQQCFSALVWIGPEALERGLDCFTWTVAHVLKHLCDYYAERSAFEIGTIIEPFLWNRKVVSARKDLPRELSADRAAKRYFISRFGREEFIVFLQEKAVTMGLEGCFEHYMAMAPKAAISLTHAELTFFHTHGPYLERHRPEGYARAVRLVSELERNARRAWEC